jgi:hypothetical protein
LTLTWVGHLRINVIGYEIEKCRKCGETISFGVLLIAVGNSGEK